MERFNLKFALLAGVAGTVAMTMMMMAAPLMGMPEMNVPGMLAGFMGMPIFVGWMAHFMIGTALATGYAIVFATRGSMRGWIKGEMFSVIPWLMAQLMVMPMMGAPLFGGSVMMSMGSLVGHIIFGTVVGIVYRPKPCLDGMNCHDSVHAKKGSAIA